MPSRSRPDGEPAAAVHDTSWKRKFRRRLLAWFRRHARDLPWRRRRTPYWVWVSEIMLQQTQAATVGPYFERFIASLPNVKALASAREEDVLRLWEGLGYYSRARRLHQAAQVIVKRHGGRLPRQVEALRALPGVGRYTAGAIVSIAWDAREPILEANSERVLSRLLGRRQDAGRGAAQRGLWSLAGELLPRKHVGDFNQALMELGSEICTPRAPRCSQCPAGELCPTRAAGLQNVIPAPKPRPRYEHVHEAAVVVFRRGRVLLQRYGPGQRWAGLWDFPRFPIKAAPGPPRMRELAAQVRQFAGVTVQVGRQIASIKHAVARRRITLLCYEATCVSGRTRRGESEVAWVSPSELQGRPLNVAGRQISRLIAGRRGRQI